MISWPRCERGGEIVDYTIGLCSCGECSTPRPDFAARDEATGLSTEELEILEACLPDGESPREIMDARAHERLEKLGLMNRRSGEAPGGGTAEFWGTNEHGTWALRIAKRSARPGGASQ